MNEDIENENFKDRYILSELRSDHFKDMRWELNHGVSGYRVTNMVFEGACLSSKWDSMQCNIACE